MKIQEFGWILADSQQAGRNWVPTQFDRKKPGRNLKIKFLQNPGRDNARVSIKGNVQFVDNEKPLITKR